MPSLAEDMHARLEQTISYLARTLKRGYQLSVRTSSAGDVLYVNDVSYVQPDLVIFKGRLKSGEAAVSIQRADEVNVLVVAAAEAGGGSIQFRGPGPAPLE